MNNIHFYTSSRGPLGQHLHGRTGLSKGQKWNKYLNIFTVELALVKDKSEINIWIFY